jgi:N-acylneuraminate cytidylyltransferase
MSKIVALIPLRGGSKSIPKKNIKVIGGKPLCAWVIESAVKCKSINQVYVSTDSTEISKVVEELDLGVQIIKRPAALATDEASTESVMQHFASKVDFDVLVTIQATSPLLKAKHLEEAILKFSVKRFESMLSAVRIKRFFWKDNCTPINYDPFYRPRRQDFSGTLMENGAFYLTSRAILEKHKNRLGGRIGIFEMPEDTSIEIDEQNDWDAVEKILMIGSGL